MAKPVSVPNSFATSTSAIPLSYLDQNFNALANSTNDLATYSNYVADTGAANAYIANFPTNTNTSSLTAGLRMQFKATNANTGASTLNVQVNSVSIGSGSIVLTDGSALSANSIVANAVVDVIYDGSNFQLINDASGASETISNLTVTNDATIGGNLTVDTNTLYVDATNNEVGIGTTSPAGKLHSYSNSASPVDTGVFQNAGGQSILKILTPNTSDGIIAFGDPDDGNVGRISYNHSSNYMNFLTSDIERMRIDSSGNVGIGTSTLATKLTVEGVKTNIDLDSNGILLIRDTTAYNSSPAAGLQFSVKYNAAGTTAAGLSIQGIKENATDGNYAQAMLFTTQAQGDSPRERMRIDSSGNVGIGTSAAGYGDLTLLRQATTATNATLSLVSGTSGYGRLFFGDTQNAAGEYDGFIQYDQANRLMQFGTAQTEHMRITSTGDVAIGTSTASGKLKVSQGSSTDCNINFEAFVANYAVNLSLIGNNASGSKFNNIVSKYGATEQWYIGGAGVDATLAFKTGGSERMRIDSSGNVGIGTSSPTVRLDVTSAASTVAKFTYSTVSSVMYNSTASGTSYWGDPTVANSFAVNAGSNYVSAWTNNSERMRIDSSGDVLVGTTSTSNVAGVPAHHMFVRSATDAQWTLALQNTAASGGARGLCVNYSGQSPNNTNMEPMFFSDSVNYRFALRSNGGIANYSANDVNLSDRREKTNFAPAKSYLQTICSIPVQTFNYIDQNLQEDDGLTLGVVAQDVQAVAPELVTESDWGSDGNPKMRLSVYQTDLTYALMKCIQEQQEIIKALEARIQALENK